MFRSEVLAVCISLATAVAASIVTAAPAQEGFLENSGTASIRPALSTGAIQGFLPERGAFTFPAPYNTRAFRLTNSSDCAGNDCVNYAGYAYWRNMNNHVGMDSMLIFLGLDQNRGGKGPTLFELDKKTGQVNDLGALFPPNSSLSWATGEGWYFSATMPTKLYINDGPRIVRFDVISEEMQTVVDVTEELGSGYYLSQIHSSDDDRVHSATVREDKNYQVLGCMAYEEDTTRYHFYPVEKDFDECQIDRSGEWLVIKANLDGKNGEDNLIVNLKTGNERVLLDEDGAAGHSDVGHGYMVAADNWADKANTWKVWDFSQTELRGERVYHNSDWSVAAPNHVSHTNARADVAARDQYACGSSVSSNAGPHANEIVCFNLDGSESTVVVAPVMTDLHATGGGNDYAKAPKGNLDITGRYFLWTSNAGGSRLDAFIVQVPDHLLTGKTDGGITVPDPDADRPGVDKPEVDKPGPDAETPDMGRPGQPETPPSNGSMQWHDTRNVTVAGSVVTKTSGCNGCGDAGAISTHSVTKGSASFAFTADASGPMLSAGLTKQQAIAGANGLDFSVRLQHGIAEVREAGVYRADTAFTPGDRFKIDVDGGQVKYSRNGTVFYTSAVPVQNPLFAGVTLNNTGAAVRDVQFNIADGGEISNSGSARPGTGDELLSNDNLTADTILWHNKKNVQVSGRSVAKSSGCDGCADAGAVSLQSVTRGKASFDFTADAAGPMLSAGFTSQQAIAIGAEPEFSVRLQQGNAEVREHGVYRAGTAFAAGDRFTIVVDNGRLEYLRNGTVFHVSALTAQYPLFAGISMNNAGAKVSNLRFVVEESPQLSAMTVNHTNPGELEINCQTDRPAESMVEFGMNGQLGSYSKHDTRLSGTHRVVLQGLVPGKKYHFQALNRDAEGHISSSGNLAVTVPI